MSTPGKLKGVLASPYPPPNDLCLDNTPASAFLIFLLRLSEMVTLKMAMAGLKLVTLLQELTVT